MALMTIQEYIDFKGKTMEKPLDSMDSKMDKTPATPEKYVTKGKNYSFPAALDKKPNPYISSNMKTSQKADDQVGLGDLGTPDTDFTQSKSDVSAVSELKEHCGCEKKKAPFVVAYSSGSYHPDPIQAIKYIVYLTNENENILKALMHEARKSGCLRKYTDYLLRTPELYQSLQDRVANDGPESLLQRIGLVRNESTEKIIDMDADKKPNKPNKVKTPSKLSPTKDKSKGDKSYEAGLTDYASK